MDDDLFLSSQHPVSRRWAIVEDDGRSAWLYLTAPDSTEPVAHAWLYNRVEAPVERIFGRGDAPVVEARWLKDAAPAPRPSPESVELRWTQDGQGVAVFIAEVLTGCIALPEGRGFSRRLAIPSPYGLPLDEAGCAAMFPRRDKT